MLEKLILSLIGILLIGALVGSSVFALWVNILLVAALLLYLYKVWTSD
jgi:hypothetical protein